jgi:hypothetical protein
VKREKKRVQRRLGFFGDAMFEVVLELIVSIGGSILLGL